MQSVPRLPLPRISRQSHPQCHTILSSQDPPCPVQTVTRFAMTVTGLRVVLCCGQRQASRPRCFSCASLNGRRRGRWCALGATLQHRTRKPVDLIEGPNKVFKGRSTKGPQLHVHQWRPQGRWHSMIFGLCEGAIAPGCQRPPSNFSGSFACRGQGDGTDTWFVATPCPHFGL